MKRKLNENDVPEEVSGSSKKPFWESSAAFDKLGLDSRLLQSILSQKFSKPTPIQARAIPLAFEGKDILGIHILLPLPLKHHSLTYSSSLQNRLW
jgi:ATP-dependent RNA helicase DDX56/DBP9